MGRLDHVGLLEQLRQFKISLVSLIGGAARRQHPLGRSIRSALMLVERWPDQGGETARPLALTSSSTRAARPPQWSPSLLVAVPSLCVTFPSRPDRSPPPSQSMRFPDGNIPKELLSGQLSGSDDSEGEEEILLSEHHNRQGGRSQPVPQPPAPRLPAIAAHSSAMTPSLPSCLNLHHCPPALPSRFNRHLCPPAPPSSASAFVAPSPAGVSLLPPTSSS